MKREELTEDFLRETFDYNKEEGTIFWKVGRRKGFQAKTKCHSGYRANIHGLMVQVSNIIWCLETGSMPEAKMHHINGDCLDNRFSNLELGRSKSNPNNIPLSQAELKSQMTYDPETGYFTSASGRRVGYKCKDGYMQITMADNSQRKAHRLAWLYMTGHFPNGILDHIDGDRTNNRWDNLREASFSQNAMNGRHRSNNTSGYKGVSFDKKYQKYEAYIWKDNRKKFLGFFDCPQEASMAYQRASEVMHGEYARNET